MLQAERQFESGETAELASEIERLRQVEQCFDDFANSTRDFAFISLDLSNAVIGWNKGAEHVLGYSQDEILGQPGDLFFTPEDVTKGEVKREMETAMVCGRAEDERWHVRKDGSRFWGSGVMTLLRDKAGSVRGFAKVMRDYTEQRQRMEALRASEERFRLLVENVRDCALFQVDVEGNVTDWNSGAERIFGYCASEVLGRSAIELFAADASGKELLRIDLETAAREGGATAECWMMRKNGSRFYARWVTNATREEAGQLVGFAKVLRDETERKRMEEDREQQLRHDRELLEGQVRFTNSALDRTKEELQALASELLNAQETERRKITRDLHDHLAQRLAFVDMSLGRLRNGLPCNLSQLQSELEGIQNQISGLSDEVRDLSHRLHPSTLEHIGIVPALKGLVDQFRSHRTNTIDLDAADFFEEGVPSEVRTVLYRISEEALRNVERHAGDVPVKVTLYRDPEAVHLEIQDQGPGLSQGAIKGKVTLGLISMAERARLVGGILELHSVPGDGALLKVTVPVTPKAYDADAASSGR